MFMKNRLFLFLTGCLVFAAIGVFSVTLYRALYVSPLEIEMPGPPPGITVIHSSTSTMPIQLQIPTLAIDAKVQDVGIAKSGAMGIPSNFTDVAWYKYGPVPGAIGNAVIDGHLDNAVSLPGVFKHLGDIHIGDDIYVVNASGQQLHFKVTKTESLDYNSTSTDEIFGPSATSNLILITCGGTWNQSIKEYSNRLIVFSTLVH
jgi:sortase A